MMTKEEAIYLLRNTAWLAPSLEPVEEAVDMASDALNGVIELSLPWIPCSEQLPSEKGEYLVTYHPCYWDRVEPEVKVGIDTFRGKTSWAKRKYQKVIAWKPLPMPWEGEEDEADKSQSE